MNAELIMTLVSIGLGLVATIFTGKWLIAKNKLKQFQSMLKEGYDVVAASVDAISDDKITEAEVAIIKKEAKEFKAAARLLFNREKQLL